jgi:hypothetical protein
MVLMPPSIAIALNNKVLTIQDTGVSCLIEPLLNITAENLMLEFDTASSSG